MFRYHKNVRIGRKPQTLIDFKTSLVVVNAMKQNDIALLNDHKVIIAQFSWYQFKSIIKKQVMPLFNHRRCILQMAA